MKLTNQIQQLFYKTQLFRTLVDKYASTPEAVVIPKQQVQEIVSKTVSEEVQKAELLAKNEAKRYRYPNWVNSNTNPDRKLHGDVPYSYMRRMATLYPIARACINRRVRQITGLDWDISTVDEKKEVDGFKDQIKFIKDMFKTPMGHKTRMREMLTIMVDDTLTVDATCFEYQKTRGGAFINLIPVDPTTIVLRVTPTGGTPEPPEPAYAQFIAGQKVAEFTTAEMIYEVMNPRSYSPYGQSPLESLILQVESALRGALYNLEYFRENNVPEGFITLPEEVAQTKDEVEQWQQWFDDLLSGNSKATRRLKILPGNSTYTPAKKPEDMAFERFEMWLLQQTCAMFDVQPQDIGITYQVNKATGESQQDISREKGLMPLANFLKEIFDEIIQVELGFTDLQFVWTNVNPVDRKEEVEIAEKEINIGALGVDEYRAKQGREPLGLEPYIKTGKGIMLVKDVVSGKAFEQQKGDTEDLGGDQQDKKKAKPEEDPEKMEQIDIKKWRKRVFNDLEQGRKIKTNFQSQYIHPETQVALSEALKGVHNRHQAKLLFDQFLDPEVKASMRLLKMAEEMRRIENAEFVEN